MKICCYCEQWESGGIESFVTTLLEHLDMDELEIDLVLSSKKQSVFDERLQNLPINIIVLSNGKQSILKNHKLLRNFLRTKKYDVFHLHAFHGYSLICLFYAYKNNIKTRIAHSHNNTLRKSATLWLKLLIHNCSKWIFQPFATDKWACSSQAGSFLYGSSPYTTINNGIDFQTFSFSKSKREQYRTALNISQNYVIGHVGRLSYQKNQDFLLDILFHTLKKEPTALLLLIGEGTDEEQLREKATTLELTNHIIFYQTSSDIPSLLSAMDIFVFPSLFEGFGITMLEAQANGLYVVCSTGIPTQTHITSNVTALPLDAPISLWVDEILKHLNRKIDKNTNYQLEHSGYSIKESVSQVKTVYNSNQKNISQ